MNLRGDDLEAAYYAVAGFIRQCCLIGRIPPPEVRRVYKRLDSHIRLSQGRHETGSTATAEASSNEETWIGSRQAALILGWSKRQVQRHATELGGQITSGRWLFRESEVIDYAEAQNARTGLRARHSQGGATGRQLPQE